jgi:hypothetical protein
MTKRQYLMTSRNLNVVSKRKRMVLRCRLCGRLLRVGDVVVSLARKNGAVLYHADCYEGMFLDV